MRSEKMGRQADCDPRVVVGRGRVEGVRAFIYQWHPRAPMKSWGFLVGTVADSGAPLAHGRHLIGYGGRTEIDDATGQGIRRPSPLADALPGTVPYRSDISTTLKS